VTWWFLGGRESASSSNPPLSSWNYACTISLLMPNTMCPSFIRSLLKRYSLGFHNDRTHWVDWSACPHWVDWPAHTGWTGLSTLMPAHTGWTGLPTLMPAHTGWTDLPTLSGLACRHWVDWSAHTGWTGLPTLDGLVCPHGQGFSASDWTIISPPIFVRQLMFFLSDLVEFHEKSLRRRHFWSMEKVLKSAIYM
jgi:hypothetical protein